MRKMKKLVVGNWKMHPRDIAESKKIAGDVKRGMRNIKKTQVVMCPPFIFLGVLQNIPTKDIFLGAQDAFYEPIGAYTGEVSYVELVDFKVSHVIIGHSERRARGEINEMVNKKVLRVLGEGLSAILCVGEGIRDREGNYLEFIKGQIGSALKDINKRSLEHLIIAYEPVWAIGKTAMLPTDVHETSIFIRKVLRDMYGPLGDSVRILYGGAVEPGNAGAIVRDGFVSGLLVGHESIKPKDFLEIIREVDSI